MKITNFMKKFVSTGLSLTLMLALTACNDEKSSSESVAKADAPIEINYWHVNSETFGGPKVTELIKKFNETHPHIVVKDKFVPANYIGIMQEMQAAAVTKNIPDVVQIGWPYMEYFSNNFNYTEPQALVAEFAPNNPNYIKDTFVDSIFNLTTNAEGKSVGFPYGISNAMLYVNPKLLAAAGATIDDIQTWTGIREVSKKILDNTGKFGLYIAEWNSLWELQQIVESNGGKFITDGKSSLNSPEAIEAIQLYADMVLEDKSALHAIYDEGRQAFLNGEVAMFYTPVSDNMIVTGTLGEDVLAVSCPTWEGKKRAAPVGGNFLAVTSEDQAKKQAAFEFVQFMLTAESMVTWTSGVGYIPHVKGVDASKLHKNVALAATVLEDTVPWYCFSGSEGLNAEQILISYRDKILGGNIDVASAVKAIDEEINALYE